VEGGVSRGLFLGISTRRARFELPVSPSVFQFSISEDSSEFPCVVVAYAIVRTPHRGTSLDSCAFEANYSPL